MNITRPLIRNIAIIAHVDHGKTTLVDKLLHQSGTINTNATDRIMDSNALEKERGITILAKNTGVKYENYHINIVDTPGHSDFSGEVERTLQMVEGFLLLVDAAEGVLPGTRFVLQKALQLNLKPIVFINKIDRKDADIPKTEAMISDLFLELASTDEQLDFPILYGSSRFGFATTNPNEPTDSMEPLFKAILEYIPAPQEFDSSAVQFLVTNIDHSDFLGTIAIGRMLSGTLKINDQFVYCYNNTTSKISRITKLYTFCGLNKMETQSISFGDIAALTGCEEIQIGSTICSPDNKKPYAYVSIDEPTLTMYIGVNDSPFNGREGSLITSRQIKERLEKELKTNISLRVEQTNSPDTFKVSGRGQLHLGILLETMRREGFEMQVSAPEVIYKTIDGQKNEPIEHLILDVPEEFQGIAMDKLGTKRAILFNLQADHNNRIRMEFKIPARGLVGFKSQFLTDTRGTGIMNSTFSGYEPYKGDIPVRTKGALVSMENGTTTGYALDALQPRGIMFIEPAEKIYEGMIVGEHSRDNDLDVNPCKQKKLTNMRASGTDDAVKLAPITKMTLEQCMEWIRPDELIEITPISIRLRKKILRSSIRK